MVYLDYLNKGIRLNENIDWLPIQILVTVRQRGVGAGGGIQTELEEVESRGEEYPMTRAFLTLLATLTDSPVPAALGAGMRAPGFDPYLEYVRDAVFLKFGSRAYKNPAEKVTSLLTS